MILINTSQRLILLLSFLTLNSCCKKEMAEPLLPKCIQNEINNSSRSPAIKSVRIQVINGETHYWLQDGNSDDDAGIEDIVDINCNKICFYCVSCHQPSCLDKYYNHEWQVIWKR